MPSLFDTERHDKLLSVAVNELGRLDEVLLIWLEGALALGSADRYADVDLHVSIDDDDMEAFHARRVDVVRAVGGAVLMREESGPSAVLTVLYDNGVTMRLTAEKLSQITARPRLVAKVLLDRDGYADDLAVSPRSPLPKEFQRERITRDISEFWFCVAAFPKEIRRGYSVALCQSQLALLRALLARMMVLCSEPRKALGLPQDAVSALTQQENDEIESTVDAGPSLAGTWATLIRICQLYSRYAKRACHSLGMLYPDDVETAVRAYVYCELADRLPAGDWWKP